MGPSVHHQSHFTDEEADHLDTVATESILASIEGVLTVCQAQWLMGAHRVLSPTCCWRRLAERKTRLRWAHGPSERCPSPAPETSPHGFYILTLGLGHIPIQTDGCSMNDRILTHMARGWPCTEGQVYLSLWPCPLASVTDRARRSPGTLSLREQVKWA